jgi:hypothetical protein
MNYKNFDIELYGYANTNDQESIFVRVTNSPAGDQGPAQAEQVILEDGLHHRAARLKHFSMFEAYELISLGEGLGKLILPANARELWFESLHFLKEDEGLRLRLKLDAWPLADLPWEFVYISKRSEKDTRKEVDGFLALDRRISIVRYEYTDHAFIPFEPGEDRVIRQLVLLSQPKNLSKLDVKGEAENIAHALQSVTNLALEVLEDPMVETLQEALERPTHIFHFAGFGDYSEEGNPGKDSSSPEGTGSIVLCDSEGMAARFPANKLALNLVRCGVRIAFLNCNYSASRGSAQRLSGVASGLAYMGIPAVIGLNGAIPDNAAVIFSKVFYRNLAAGNPVDTAVTNARIALYSVVQQDDISWGIPVLYLRSDENTLFPIRPRPPKPAGEWSAMPGSLVLRQILVENFNINELRLLCDDISAAFERDRIQQRVDLEIVGGSTLETIALNLIQHLERRKLLSYLVEAVKAVRPNLSSTGKL